MIGWTKSCCKYSQNCIPTIIFFSFFSVVADTWVAMDEWVQNPRAYTALDDILPCVDSSTAQDILFQSRDVTFRSVGAVNFFINNVANKDLSAAAGTPVYYNQSGPFVPVLWNPYNSNKTDRNCSAAEVNVTNAAQVILWPFSQNFWLNLWFTALTFKQLSVSCRKTNREIQPCHCFSHGNGGSISAKFQQLVIAQV